VLSKLKNEPNVYALAFHVDYWNGSWTDRFSSTAATSRQRSYGFGTYTPQLVIDGRAHVLGSDEEAARSEMTSSHARERVVSTKLEGDTLHWTIDQPIANTNLLIALTEDGITSKITAGENSGETLVHDAVVRWFTVVPATRIGSHELQIKSDVRRDRARVIVLLQAASGELLAASGSPASPKPSPTK
jgi:hypothetical protein